MRGFRCIGRFNEAPTDYLEDDLLFLAPYHTGENMRRGSVRGRDLNTSRIDDIEGAAYLDYVFVAVALGENCFK